MVYFGTKLYAIKSGDGIYVSTDNGGTWAEVLNGSFVQLVIAGSYLVALGATVYRTTDGTTWTNANSNVSLNAAPYVTVLDTTIFARQNYKYIYFSTDYGTTWHNVGYELPSNQSSYGYSLERVNATVLAGSYDGVYKLVEVVK
ncbi:MAG: hypothetical protein BWY95_02824 [Bacteroidetes bacterium ADurb.BinA104]|nr:MAG: hypothetical protein BWY95_02824 [Bacteroidetes bacterium ADurb.BinA104]